MIREEVCKVALSYLDTPFHHQGRKKAVGLDCAGFIVELAKECKLYKDKVIDLKNYSASPDGKTLREALLKGTAKEKLFTDIKIGDIILMRFLQNPQHLALYMPDNKIIHAYSTAGKVIIHDLDDKWKNKIVSVFEFENIKD